MDSNQQELVAQFCGVTGANAGTAQGALTSADWNLEAAVALYFAAQEGGEGGEAEAPQPSASASAPTPSAPQPSGGAARSRQPPRGGVRSLRDLQGGGGDDDEEDDGKNPRDLFAGGEKSGLAVQDPHQGQRGGDHFNNIMNQARQNRPRPPLGDDDEEDEAPQPERRSNFTGRAQTLGGDDAPSRTIEDPTAPSSSMPQSAASLPRVTRTMHLWNDGVSIDDGPLFRFDDPANQQIMEQINRGQAPLSMLDVQPGQEVDLQLDPHQGQNYTKPKPKYKPFSGSGQRLGSPTPGASSTTAASSSQPAAAPAAPASSAPKNDVDESQPTLTLQIRLGDGTRLQSRFNTSQTIGDVYDFVNRASSASGQRAYALMTTFPSKELEDKSVVLGDMADFKRGGVVVQKWK